MRFSTNAILAIQVLSGSSLVASQSQCLPSDITYSGARTIVIGKCIGYDQYGDLYPYTCTDNSAQAFQLDSDNRLVAQGGSRVGQCVWADGEYPKLSTCDTSEGQKWSYSGGQFRTIGGANCLGLFDSPSLRAKVYSCTENMNDAWTYPVCTNSPTTAPTQAPTQAPTPAPWDIIFQDMTANFGVNSTDEVVMTYKVGKGRGLNYVLYNKGCKSPANVTGMDYNVTNSTGVAVEPGMDMLTLRYNFDKANITSSSIWNQTANKIQFCQIIQLTEPGPNNQIMIITEDMHEMAIDFDLTAEFDILSALGAATINAANDTTNVDSYVSACQCDGIGFNCNTNDLVPNKELIVCIYSASSDVGINYVKSMLVKQAGKEAMPVISNRNITFSSITTLQKGDTGFVVSTRIPTNIFDFETPSSTIEITGEVVMELGDSSTGRKLVAATDAGLETNGDASFELQVALKQELVSEESPVSTAMSVSATGIVTVLGMVASLAYVTW